MTYPFMGFIKPTLLDRPCFLKWNSNCLTITAFMAQHHTLYFVKNVDNGSWGGKIIIYMYVFLYLIKKVIVHEFCSDFIDENIFCFYAYFVHLKSCSYEQKLSGFQAKQSLPTEWMTLLLDPYAPCSWNLLEQGCILGYVPCYVVYIMHLIRSNILMSRCRSSL